MFGEGIRNKSELSIWEQFGLVYLSYKDIGQIIKLVVRLHLILKQKINQIAPCLNYYQYHLKGISLLPRHDYEMYQQMFYESSIDEETYEKEVKKLGKLSFGVIKNEEDLK